MYVVGVRLMQTNQTHNIRQTVEKVEKDVDRDYFMSPHEAMEYGLIDKVIERSK